MKRLKLVMVSSFHPHSMCKIVEMVMAKTGSTSCTNWTISFKVSSFRTKTHVLQRHFIFFTIYCKATASQPFIFFKLISTPDFLRVQYAPFKATSSTFNPFCLHLLFFMHLLICLELNDPEI